MAWTHAVLRINARSSPEVLDTQAIEREKPLNPSVSGIKFLPSSLAVQVLGGTLYILPHLSLAAPK